MKNNTLKNVVKKAALTVMAAVVMVSSVTASTVTAEAKGTAFINKKVSSVTPKVKSAKRTKKGVTVTVSIPSSKVKKLGKVRKVTVSYGTTKSSKKFEGKKVKVRVTRRSATSYSFTFKNQTVLGAKNVYLTVRFDGKSNWSKLVKVSGKRLFNPNDNIVDTDNGEKEEKPKYRWTVKCNGCDMQWQGNDLYELVDKHEEHRAEEYDKVFSACGGHPSVEDIQGVSKHSGYTNYEN